MTRRLNGGRAGGGGAGIGSVSSTDGSLTIAQVGSAVDLSLHALGSTPNETTIISKESDFPAPVAGQVTLSGRYTLTGPVTMSDDIELVGPNGGDAVIEGAVGVEGCSLTGNVAGSFLTGSITLEKFRVTNIHASGEDFAIGDTTDRILHIRLVTSSGTASGRITNHSGAMEVFNFVQDGAQSGLICASDYGAIRFIGGFYNPLVTPASFTSVTFTDTATVAGFLSFSDNTFTSVAATQFGFRFDDGMSIQDAGLLFTGNTTIGPGSTIDQGPGNITSSDQRLVASANLDIPDWLGKITAQFRDPVTPISFAPTGTITTFDVVPSENVGPTSVLTELTGARNFRLVRNSIQDYYLEYIGDRDGVTADLVWVLTAGKSSPATGRATAAKLTVDRAPVTGTYVDIDGEEVSIRDFQVVGTLFTNDGAVSTEVSFGDRFTLEIASESTDLQTYTTIQLGAETR